LSVPPLAGEGEEGGHSCTFEVSVTGNFLFKRKLRMEQHGELRSCFKRGAAGGAVESRCVSILIPLESRSAKEG
jgi:hypothetical protein